MLERLIRADPRRRTRLHDFEGNRVPLAVFVDLVPSMVSALLRKAGVPPRSPWLPYPLVRHLGRLLDASWSVLEFGSGASTAWLASRVAMVHSHEHDTHWYARVEAMVAKSGRRNVSLSLLASRAEYVSIDTYGGQRFDRVLIDGNWRDACAESAVRAVRPGGYIYLDNSDVPDSDHRHALRTILDVTDESRFFVGFCPGQVAASQGLLIRVRRLQSSSCASDRHRP